MPRSPSHDSILKLLKKLGYPHDDPGICYGIAATALHMQMNGKSEIFNKCMLALGRIVNHLEKGNPNKKEYKRRLAVLRETLKEKNANTQDFLDTLALMETFSVSYNPSNYKQLYPETANFNQRQSSQFEETALYFSPEGSTDTSARYEINEQGESIEGSGLSCIIAREGRDKNSVIKMLRDFEVACQGLKDPVGFMIEDEKHAISICYYPETKTWVFTDVNDLKYLAKNNLDHKAIGELIVGAFDGAAIQLHVVTTRSQFTQAHQLLSPWTNRHQQNGLVVNDKSEVTFINSTLILAVKDNNLDAAKQAVMNLESRKNGLKGVTDKHDNTVIHLAAYCWNMKLFDFIFEKIENDKTIDINALNDLKNTALHRAAKNGLASIVEKLLTHKHINPNLENENGRTPLDSSIKRGINIPIIEAFVNHPKTSDKTIASAIKRVDKLLDKETNPSEKNKLNNAMQILLEGRLSKAIAHDNREAIEAVKNHPMYRDQKKDADRLDLLQQIRDDQSEPGDDNTDDLSRQIRDNQSESGDDNTNDHLDDIPDGWSDTSDDTIISDKQNPQEIDATLTDEKKPPKPSHFKI